MTPGLEPASLERWLSVRLPGARAPFEYRLIAGGHSNITYRVEDASGSRFVLRRPPLGTQPPGAHDVAREYRIQAALRPTNVPVPYVELLCEDTAVIGAPFYVMRWVEGTVVDSPSCVAAALPTALSRIPGFLPGKPSVCAVYGRGPRRASCRSSSHCTSVWSAIARRSATPVSFTMTTGSEISCWTAATG